jgi:hypothetical protein
VQQERRVAISRSWLEGGLPNGKAARVSFPKSVRHRAAEMAETFVPAAGVESL